MMPQVGQKSQKIFCTAKSLGCRAGSGRGNCGRDPLVSSARNEGRRLATASHNFPSEPQPPPPAKPPAGGMLGDSDSGPSRRTTAGTHTRVYPPGPTFSRNAQWPAGLSCGAPEAPRPCLNAGPPGRPRNEVRLCTDGLPHAVVLPKPEIPEQRKLLPPGKAIHSSIRSASPHRHVRPELPGKPFQSP